MKKRKFKKNTVLLKFLKKAKTGIYAKVDKASLKYTRASGSFDMDADVDTHYYSLG